MSDILSLVGSAITTVGAIFDFAKAINNPDLELELSTLKRLLAETQSRVAVLLDENRQLKELLDQERNTPLSFDSHSGFYVDQEHARFCPACYEEKRLRSHLRKDIQVFDPWFCPVCKQNYRGELS